MKKNKKGFTLIELIITIGILAIILALGAYFVINSINNTKEITVNITNENLLAASKLYVLEFKQNSSFWYDEVTDNKLTGNEYACTTIQVLINKGFLPSNLSFPDSKEGIDASSFVKITRNSSTKSSVFEVLMGSEECSAYDDVSPSATFKFEGTLINEWYNNLSILITPVVGKSGASEINYYTKLNNENGNELISNINGEIKYNVLTNGGNLQVCAVVTNGIGVIGKETCSKNFNFDNLKPSIKLTSNISGKINVSVIESNIESYCITTSNQYSDCLWIDVNNNNFNLDVTENNKYYVYVKDKAGNIGNESIDIILEKVVTVNCSVSSTSSTCSKSQTISDLGSIKSIETNNGNVTYTLSNNTINMKFNDGSYTPGTNSKCNCSTSSYDCRCKNVNCNCSNYDCNCRDMCYNPRTISYNCNCTTSSYNCNCRTTSYDCNCTYHSYNCNCVYHSYNCNCKTTSYFCNCRPMAIYPGRNNAFYQTSYDCDTCYSTSCNTCGYTSCDTCYYRSCGTCYTTSCDTCYSTSCDTCYYTTCDTKRECDTCQTCDTCRSCDTCYSTSCDTCYTYDYTATITYILK